MSVELIAIVTVGLTLAGLILTSNRGLRSDMTKVEERLRQDIQAGRTAGVPGQWAERRGRREPDRTFTIAGAHALCANMGGTLA